MRIPSRSDLARAIGRGEKASTFCVVREKWDGCRCVTWLDAHLEGAHSRLDGLKAEVRWQSLLVAMGGRKEIWEAAKVNVSNIDVED